MVHTMCITKDVDADGNVIYTLHNDYSSKQYDDNETFYGFTYANSIEDVMSQYQDGNYRLIDLIGVKLT